MIGDYLNPFDVIQTDIASAQVGQSTGAGPSVKHPTISFIPRVTVNSDGTLKRRGIWGLSNWGSQDTW